MISLQTGPERKLISVSGFMTLLLIILAEGAQEDLRTRSSGGRMRMCIVLRKAESRLGSGNFTPSAAARCRIA